MNLTEPSNQTEYTLDLGKRNGGVKKFKDEAAAAQFLVREYEKWKWLHDHRFRIIPNASPTRIYDQFTRSLASIGTVSANLEEFIEIGLPLSTGPTGKWILKHHLSGASSFAEALVRSSAKKKGWINPSDPNDLNAVIELSLFERNLAPEKANAVNEDLAASINSFEAQVENLRIDAVKSINELETTNAAYSKHMELNASYKYWSQKAVTHGTKEKQLKTSLLRFAPISLFILAALPIFLGWATGLSFSDGISLGSIWLLSLSILFTSVAFWCGRILTRIYLSQQHLRIDAEERATMVQSYVALTKEQAVGENDRALILAPLFRPTADGLVKDDAAPDILAQIFSRIPK